MKTEREMYMAKPKSILAMDIVHYKNRAVENMKLVESKQNEIQKFHSENTRLANRINDLLVQKEALVALLDVANSTIKTFAKRS
jgi:hypothetical protein